MAKITRQRVRKPRTHLNVNHPFFHLALRLRKSWLPTITNSGIHNLSTKGISTKSISALSLGLNFIPVPRLQHSLASHLLTQWQDFRRRVNIQYFFRVYPTPNSTMNKYRLKSHWEPTVDDFKPYTYSKTVSDYLMQVKNNLLSAASTLQPSFSSALHLYQNPPWLIPSLRELRNNHDIIITEADKNMGIVLIDKDRYIAEGLRQLQCPNTYDNNCTINHMLFRKLYAILRNILHQHNKLYNTTYNRSQKQLSQLAKFLLELETQHTRDSNDYELCAAKFYLLLKMHKTPVAGRPIVSTVNSFTYNVSRYVDGELKCLLTLIPSYIESSQQLIYILEKQTFPSSCVICCADIESLYPNIPIIEGLAFVRKSILRLRDQLPYQSPLQNNDHVDMIMSLMTWVLKNNYFKFGKQWYLQLQGTAMGTPLAVPFACLFVAHIEHLIWNSTTTILPSPLFYRRYIDDIFYVAHTKEDAEKFFHQFNNVLATIRCGSITIDNHSGIFLDIDIYKGSRFQSHNILDFRTYQKSQNRYLYLAPNSFHRRDIFKSTIVSELNRYRLTCSDDNDFIRMRNLFYQRLVARGYNSKYLNLIFPCHANREELLQRIQQRFTIINNNDQVPLLFKITNTFELSNIRLSQLTKVPDPIRDQINTTDEHASSILSQPVISCFSNSTSSYKYIGNGRKTLYQK